MRKLRSAFFQRQARIVARELIGAILVHRVGRRVYRARLVETEAYVGAHDLACHAARGRTGRTEVMFLPGGHVYVYLIYGMHEMLNIVTGSRDDPQAVLIRAAEPLDGWRADLSGPGKLARAMHITRKLNGMDLAGTTLYLEKGPPPARIIVTRRIGVDYSGSWKDAMLRFIDADSKGISGPKKLNRATAEE